MTVNQLVVGSIPTAGAKIPLNLWWLADLSTIKCPPAFSRRDRRWTEKPRMEDFDSAKAWSDAFTAWNDAMAAEAIRVMEANGGHRYDRAKPDPFEGTDA